MSSLTLKISSLVVRTVSKPIANYIKSQAREHERFRKLCVRFAQSLHRIDMRMRLGLLRETNTSEKKPNKDADSNASSTSRQEPAEHITSKRGDSHEERSEHKEKKKDSKDSRSKAVKIRPLSEAKAIDTGANFISETFLFLVGGSLILFESWRSRRKENIRREDVAERLEKLEALDHARDVAHQKEIDALQAEIETLKAAASKYSENEAAKSSREKTVPSQALGDRQRKPSSVLQKATMYDEAHHE